MAVAPIKPSASEALVMAVVKMDARVVAPAVKVAV